MNENHYVFVGPTLSAEQVCAVAPHVRVLPPVKAGDLLRHRFRRGDVVGIVDGLYMQTASVRHKEILALLDAGVRVGGAASLGALRAAELAPFGMRGVGQVFQDYVTGVIDGDDEVAVVHGPAERGYPALTEALVNVRERLSRAVVEGVCTPDQSASVIESVKALPFSRRTPEAILAAAGSAGGDGDDPRGLSDFLASDTGNLKARDGVAMLLAMTRSDPPEVEPSLTPRPAVSRNILLRSWLHQERGREVDGAGHVSRHEALAYWQVMGVDYPEFGRRCAVRALACSHGRNRDASDAFAVDAGEEEADFRRRRGIPTSDQLAAWLDANLLDASDLLQFLRDDATLRSMGCEAPLAFARGALTGTPGGRKLLGAAMAHLESCGHGIDPSRSDTQLAPWLTAREAKELDPEERVVRFLGRAFSQPRRYQWRDVVTPVLGVLDKMGTAVDGCAAARRVNGELGARYPEFAVRRLSRSRVIDWFQERWHAESFNLALLERGFQGVDEFLSHARPFYLYDKLSEARPEARLLD